MHIILLRILFLKRKVFYTIWICYTCILFSSTVIGQVPKIIKEINPVNEGDGLKTNLDWNTLDKAFAELNGIVLFIGNDGLNGHELWRTDGTDTGTFMIKDITEGLASTDFQGYYLAGNQLFFQVYESFESGANINIWRTDGTSAGTYMVTSFNSPINSGERIEQDNAPFYTYRKKAVIGNTLFFVTFDRDTKKYRIRKTDGSYPGNSIYFETTFNEGSPFQQNGKIENIVSYRNKLFIKADTASDYDNDLYGSEIFWSDGVQPPQLYADYTPGIASSQFSYFINVNDFYLAFNNRLQLMKIEGLGDLPVVVTTNWYVTPYLGGIIGNKLFFQNTFEFNGNESHKMFCTDGTSVGTVGSDLENPEVIGSFNEFMLFRVGARIKKWNGVGSTAEWFLDSSAAGNYQPPGRYNGAVQLGDRLLLTAEIDYKSILFLTDGTNENYVRLSPPTTLNFSGYYGHHPTVFTRSVNNLLFLKFKYIYYFNYYTPRYNSGLEPAVYNLNTIIWTGKNSSSWDDPMNWWPNRVPTASDPVLITMAPHYPSVTSGIRYAKELTVNYGNLDIGPNAQLILTK